MTIESQFNQMLSAAAASPPDTGMYILGVSIRVWSLVVATPCVIIACIISCLSMLRHCSRNRDKLIRRHLLRILFMVPIYGLNALMALIWPFNVEFFTLFREAYEAVTIYSLAQFLFIYLGGEPRLRYLLSLQDQADDEYHLYRCAQNLANTETISLPNKNFIQEPEITYVSKIDTINLNRINHNQELVHNDDITILYSNQYRQQEYEHNLPWFKRLPFFRAFFPAPDFIGKTQFSTLPLNIAPIEQEYDNNNITFDQQRLKLNKNKGNIEGKVPLLSRTPSQSPPNNISNGSNASNGSININQQQYNQNNNSKNVSYNQSNEQIGSLRSNNKFIDNDNTLSFQTRQNLTKIQATDDDRAQFKRFKEKQKLKKTLRSRQEFIDAAGGGSGGGVDQLDSLNSTDYSPSIVAITPPESQSTIPQGDGGGNHLDDNLFSLSSHHQQPPSTKSSSSSTSSSSSSQLDSFQIAISPPGEIDVNVHIDQTMANHLIDNEQQVMVTKHTPDGHDKKYLTDLHDSTTNLSAPELQQRLVTLEYHPQLAAVEKTYPHMFPLNSFFDPVSPERFLFISKFSILQYVPIQILCATIAMLGHWAGFYHPGSWKANNLYPYLSIVLNTSQMTALYGLFWFLHVFHDNLKPVKAMGKALTIKAVVFATFWQSCAISLYYLFFPWCSHESADPRRCEEGEWDSEQQAAGINSFLICVEMFIFALIHLSVFSWREFGRPLMYDSTKPVLRSVIEFFSPSDIVSDVKNNINMGNMKQVLFPRVHKSPLPQPVDETAIVPSSIPTTGSLVGTPSLPPDGAVIKVTGEDSVDNHQDEANQP